jgi:hypothetical protein
VWFFVLLAVASLVAAGCGSNKKTSKKPTKGGNSMSPGQVKSGPKGTAVKAAIAAFQKTPTDINACRNLAQSWIAYASPDAPTKPNQVVKAPSDRNKSLQNAADALVKCQSIDGKDIVVKEMLASVYMGLSQYTKAAPILQEIALKDKTNANDYYAWGLAESSALDLKATINAWTLFLKYAPKSDPRIKSTQQQIKALKAQAAHPNGTPAPAATPATSSTSTKSSKH